MNFCFVRISATAGLVLLLGACVNAEWPRHVIDRSSKGADGVRLADVNGDAALDIVTGWEEGGLVRLYLHPGTQHVRDPWPAVTVGSARSVEDAVLIDMNGDGRLDVVSACEGQHRVLQVHSAPNQHDDVLKPEAWRTSVLGASLGQTCWMFTLPMQIDERLGVDLVAGSKDPNGVIGWFQAPEQPASFESWRWHHLRAAGWIMSLVGADMDRDGDEDVLFSDRKGQRRGCYWLERPSDLAMDWVEHLVGAAGQEVMFLDQGDMNGDGRLDVVAAVKPDAAIIFLRQDDEGRLWKEQKVAWPRGTGGPKGVAVGDMNGDGRLDVVCSCEGSAGRPGVFWLDLVRDGDPVIHDISGPQGTKFDLVRLIDLDGDADLDVLTCEETENLGVIWYENRFLAEAGVNNRGAGNATQK